MRSHWEEDDFFAFDGEHFSFDEVYPYEQPETDQEVLCSATGPSSARLAADRADHLVTLANIPDVKERVIDVYRDNGGDGDVIMQVVGGYGDADRITQRIKRSFASTLHPDAFDVKDTRELQSLAEEVSDEEIQDALLVAETPEDVLEWIEVQEDRGVDEVAITDVSYEQDEFYRTASEEILPSL
jgi:alkanesulfonate monooxygenase SsuD/methylene tetrahydromethanopterin reductase-like flavin-dependent oxidoreductase (luciferase family)